MWRAGDEGQRTAVGRDAPAQAADPDTPLEPTAQYSTRPLKTRRFMVIALGIAATAIILTVAKGRLDVTGRNLLSDQSESKHRTAFAGVWLLAGPTIYSGQRWIRIAEMESGRFQLEEGSSNADGTIYWGGSENVVDLDVNGDKLIGTINSYNFRPTHATRFDYSVAVEKGRTGQLQYRVSSSLGDERFEATRAVLNQLTRQESVIETSPSAVVPLPVPLPTSGRTEPSFDCGKARTPVELLICREGELADLEKRMAEAYLRVRSRTGMRTEQAVWFKEYTNACNAASSESEMKECVAGRLRARLQALDMLLR